MALQGHSTAQAGGRRPFRVEARFRSQGIQLGTSDGQSDTCVLSRRYLPSVLHTHHLFPALTRTNQRNIFRKLKSNGQKTRLFLYL